MGFTTYTQTYLQTYHSLLTCFAHIFANLLLWNGWIIAYFFSNLFLLSINLTPKKFSLLVLWNGAWTLFFLLPPFNLLWIWNGFGMDGHSPQIVNLYFLWVSLSLLFLLTSFSFGMDGIKNIYILSFWIFSKILCNIWVLRQFAVLLHTIINYGS